MNLTNPIFHDNEAARKHLEAIRWPNGPICPHCGNADPDQVTRLKGKSTRPGLRQCNECREHFTVTVGSVMERSHVPLAKWVLAFHLMAASKKGMSAKQLERMLGVTYKTAWFMAHRIREAMADDGSSGPLGGEGKIVEADETYFGQVETPRTVTTSGRRFTKGGKTGPSNKRAVVSLVERGGRVRTFHVAKADASSVRNILVRNVTRDTTLHTDESRLYTMVGGEYAAHHTVKHSAGEYVRDKVIHSNTVENYFSIFKRGMRGIYQHCAEKHLHRYLAEFDFRYSNRIGLGINDDMRTARAILGAAGKRLTYNQTDGTAHA